jgi:A/G-specific adenine glycosylase
MPRRNRNSRGTGPARRVRGSRSSDAGLASALADWFPRARRDLPWRTSPRDPYAVLLSEVMLQQTPVPRVAEPFARFMRRLPTIDSLARARPRTVLSLWSGLGYYHRALRLRECARDVVRLHGGCIPADVDALSRLPGIGPYTAGAIASIAFNIPAPAVDGNVARVVLRLEGRRLRAGSHEGLTLARGRVAEVMGEAVRAGIPPGVITEALIELGATMCTPRTPDCRSCPARRFCRAAREGSQIRIPAPALRPTRSRLSCTSVAAVDARGRVLMEQRGPDGLWPGLWQIPTLEAAGNRFPAPDRLGLGPLRDQPYARFTHRLTHRDVVFRAYLVRHRKRDLSRHASSDRRWFGMPDVGRFGISSIQSRIVAWALSQPTNTDHYNCLDGNDDIDNIHCRSSGAHQ